MMPGTTSAVERDPQWHTHPPKPISNSGICAKLVTTNRDGGRDAVVLSINKPVTIGRNPALCSYVIRDSVVSSVHCKLYAIYSSTGGIIVSCQDLSMNGIILNGHKIHKASVILMDGDVVEIPTSQRFTCVHIRKKLLEKDNIFDPTPSSQVSYRVRRISSTDVRSGSFATVHLALDTKAHRQVACKMIRTRKEEGSAKVWREVRILLALDHPNINKVYDVEVNGRNMQIFLQLCTGGDLFTYISSYTERQCRLLEGEAKYVMYQILKGLVYLHDKSISHRDLKPENLLLYSPGPYPRILIADFGLARPKAYQETLNVCGTVQYLPPEGILALDNKHLGYVGMPADCWSAGVILFVMLTGFHPFDYDPFSQCECSSEYFSSYEDPRHPFHCSQFSMKKEVQTKKRIVDGTVDFQEDPWNAMPDAKGLVARLLIHSPLQRSTIYQALQSAWITEDLSELENAYQVRIGSG